jgi:hypothetical protein
MISRILGQAQDEENHRTGIEKTRRSSGLILSLTKDAAALTQTLPQVMHRAGHRPARRKFAPVVT